jgi:hypothetical protein
MRQSLVAFAAALALSACSDAPDPPVGRWQGVYESADAVIVARLEIAPGGAVRVSAPNAFDEIAGLSDVDRRRVLGDLSNGLSQAWPGVQPLPFTFDGKVFRKPGGVAPQMEWDDSRKQMTLIVYPGLKDTIRMPLEPVAEFPSDNS